MKTKQNSVTIPTDPDELSKTWLPRVRFEIVSELQHCQYFDFLHKLFVEFVREAEPGKAEWNEHNAFRFGDENGSEGGMGGFRIQGVYFDHCKLYGYDGTRSGHNYAKWKGFMMRNHEDQQSRTSQLYLIADILEKLLREKRIPYERYGIKVGEHKEILQSQFQPQ